jgi:asparagine synthase (glutamine-hydrolysing)
MEGVGSHFAVRVGPPSDAMLGEPSAICMRTPRLQAAVWTTTGIERFQDCDFGLDIFVKGHLYLNLADVARMYSTGGPIALKQIRGSFSLLLLDHFAGRLVLVTDPVNSYKVFVRRTGRDTWLATRLDALPLSGAQLDAGGVASYLANGYAINDRTIFSDVTSLRRACIHQFFADDFHSCEYWRWDFTNDAASDRPETLADQLVERVAAAVERCMSGMPPVSLSLSGGEDSRGIIGLLGDTFQAKIVRCFSYYHGSIHSNSDAAVAKRLAARYDYHHELVPAYRGDFLAVLDANAEAGEAVANPCDEVDAWRFLRSTAAPDLLVGDESFGWVDTRLVRPSDVLASIGIGDFSRIGWLADLLPADSRTTMADALHAEVEAVYSRCPETDDLHERKDFLYLDQRIPHVLMPWRDRFAGTVGGFVRVHRPFLDQEILDFVRRLPTPMRKNKALYRLAIRRRFPELSAIPTASRAGYLVDWRSEIERTHAQLAVRLREETSELDQLIPPHSLLRLLDRCGGISSGIRAVHRKAIGFSRSQRSVVGAAARRFLPSTPVADESLVLMRALILRGFLARAGVPSQDEPPARPP